MAAGRARQEIMNGDGASDATGTGVVIEGGGLIKGAPAACCAGARCRCSKQVPRCRRAGCGLLACSQDPETQGPCHRCHGIRRSSLARSLHSAIAK